MMITGITGYTPIRQTWSFGKKGSDDDWERRQWELSRYDGLGGSFDVRDMVEPPKPFKYDESNLNEIYKQIETLRAKMRQDKFAFRYYDCAIGILEKMISDIKKYGVASSDKPIQQIGCD